MPDKKALFGRRLLAGGFAALLLAPWPLWLALRGVLDAQNHENRTLAAFPGAETALSDWPAAFEDWLGDNAPFRNQLMALNTGLDRLTGTLNSSDVLAGAEGWLFLKDVSDSKSLSDYQGLTAYSAEETTEIVAAVQALDDALAQKGTRLAILFAPAKEGVYSRYMPKSIPVVSRPTRVQALCSVLETQTGTPVVFPLEALAIQSETQQMYYKYDTHWNEAGAWLAAQLTLDALSGREAEHPLPAMTAEGPGTAPTDLADMCAAWAYCTDDTRFQLDAPAARLEAENEGSTVQHYHSDGEGSLLLVRDSFGAALAPWLAEPFEESLVIHGNALSAATLQESLSEQPDVVVVEVGERFSDNLLPRLNTLLEWTAQ